MIEKKTHTPGPWIQNKTRDCVFADREECKLIAVLATGLNLTPLQREANARLIAAAPEMAETLASSVSRLVELAEELQSQGLKEDEQISEDCDDVWRIVDKARAALRKAGIEGA